MPCCKVFAAGQPELSEANDGEQLDRSIPCERRPPVPKGRGIIAPHKRHIHLMRTDETGDALGVRRPAHLSLAAGQTICKHLSNPLAELEGGRIGARGQNEQVAPSIDAPLAIGSVATEQYSCGAGHRLAEELPATRPCGYLTAFALVPHSISCGIWSSAGWRRPHSSARRRHCLCADRKSV